MYRGHEHLSYAHVTDTELVRNSILRSGFLGSTD
jgi:hypothetical protein